MSTFEEEAEQFLRASPGTKHLDDETLQRMASSLATEIKSAMTSAVMEKMPEWAARELYILRLKGQDFQARTVIKQHVPDAAEIEKGVLALFRGRYMSPPRFGGVATPDYDPFKTFRIRVVRERYGQMDPISSSKLEIDVRLKFDDYLRDHSTGNVGEDMETFLRNYR